MSSRSKLALGLALLVGFAALLLWLRSSDDAPAPEPTATAPRNPTRPRPTPVGAALEPAPAPAPAPISSDASSPTPEPQRDHTGELLSDGPAQPIRLPEPPAGAQDNVPTPAESEAVLTGVMQRLDDEIAAARSRGDEAEAARLEVRRARLARKLAERDL